MKALVWQRHGDTYCAVSPVGTAIVYPSTGGEFYWEVFTGNGRSRYGMEADAQDARRRAQRFVADLISPTKTNGTSILPDVIRPTRSARYQ